MKLRTYFIAVAISAIVGLLAWYGAFTFVLLETNPLKWSEESRVPFIIFCWFPSAVLSSMAVMAINLIHDYRKQTP